jgi:folate-binding protein YgfZ
MTDLATLSDAYRALRGDADARATTAARVEVPRDFVLAEGPEAASFLQGQLSQDVSGLAAGASALSFLLDPSGKLGTWLRVTRLGDERFLLDVDAGFGPAVVARLQRFKLRTKATIEPADGWSCRAVDRAGAGGPEQHTGEGLAVVAPWPGASGYDLLLAGEADRDGGAGGSAAEPAAALDAIRIEAGVPKLGAELVAEQTIPAEAGQWVIDASVSFTKGCYTGQELVARIDSRGNNVPHRLRGVVIDAPADAVIEVGAGVRLAGADVDAATLSSVAWSPGLERWVGLASFGRAVDPPADAEVVTPAGSQPARILTLPLVGA